MSNEDSDDLYSMKEESAVPPAHDSHEPGAPSDAPSNAPIEPPPAPPSRKPLIAYPKGVVPMPDSSPAGPRKSILASHDEYVAPPPDVVLPKVDAPPESQSPKLSAPPSDVKPDINQEAAPLIGDSPVIELAPVPTAEMTQASTPIATLVAAPIAYPTDSPAPATPGSASADIIPFAVSEPPIQPPAESKLAPISGPIPPRFNRWKRLAPHLGAHAITWIVVALMLGFGAIWAFHAGMDLRDQVWRGSRTIRFKDDIRNGFTWGEQVMRDAETQAGLEPMADAVANQPPKIAALAGHDPEQDRHNPAVRRLTYREIIKGIVHRTDSLVDEHPDGDYEMDYPPIRLAVMTFWVRYTQHKDPRVTRFPMERNEETGIRQPEDIAQPLLNFNAYNAAEAAVALFFLVWLWVWRSSKVAKPSARVARLRKLLGRPQPTAIATSKSSQASALRWTVPHWMVAFIFATAGFWYAFVKLASPPPRAAAIAVYQIHPRGDHADIVATLNAQNTDTTWHVEYGPTESYGQSTPPRPADTTADDQRASVRILNLEPEQTLHFRILATNPGGTTNTDDFSFKNTGSVIVVDSPMTGGIQWPHWTVWLRMLALFIIMVACARSLPAIHRGWACGAVAALILWFDPTLILDGHGWPQWDSFVLPVFVTATLLASLNCWTAAGILIGAGCMFKGQLLLGGPVLILWPLLGGRFGPFLRILTGVALGMELVTWPWLVRTPQGLNWIEIVMLAAEIVLIASLFRNPIRQAIQRWILQPLLGKNPSDLTTVPAEAPSLKLFTFPLIATGGAVLATIIAAVLIRHGIQNIDLLPAGAMKWLLLLVIIPPWFLPRRSLPFWLASTFALAVYFSALMFQGSFSWVTLGFQYGTVKHDAMQMSLHSLANLPAILGPEYNWDIHDIVGTLGFHFTTPGPWRLGSLLTIPSVTWKWSYDLDMKATMVLLYGICLVICSLAAAVHARRNDVRFLVAIVAPWAIFPQLMCQMGDRYMIWASALSAWLVAVSTGLSLLHIVLALFSMGMIARHLLNFDSNRWPDLFNFLSPMYPGVAWMMLLMSLVLLVSAVLPTRKKYFRPAAVSDPLIG